MNKFIKEQLLKIKIPMSDWNDDTRKIIIDKQRIESKTNNGFEIGEVYNIEVENYIINPPPTFTLAANWNNGTSPPEKELTAETLQIAGKMIKFNCKGKTSGVPWTGWLPLKSIKLID